jgi:hypothetical protein
VKGSTQFPSNPHWQRWTSVLPPAQKVLAFPFLSFHQAYVMVLSSSGAKLQSYYLINRHRLSLLDKNNEQKLRITLIDWWHSADSSTSAEICRLLALYLIVLE